MTTAAIKRYWGQLPDECPCGAMAADVHHIIHLNWQRITKDDWLVCKLCAACHRLLHSVGGDRQFEEQTGISTVHLAVLRRHNWEVSQR